MGRLGLISDIHANAPALDVVLSDLDARGVTRIACAGDLVGYNSFPLETMALLRRRTIASVYGSHDLMVLDRIPVTHAAPRARRGVAWTREVLTPREISELAALPGMRTLGDGIVCTHSGIGDAVVRIERDDQFRGLARSLLASDPGVTVCISGHTHRAQATHVCEDGRVETYRQDIVTLDRGGVWFVNPGSVGEPREADARASFAILDMSARQVEFLHANYDAAHVAGENLHRLPPLETDTGSGRILARIRDAARLLGTTA